MTRPKSKLQNTPKVVEFELTIVFIELHSAQFPLSGAAAGAGTGANCPIGLSPIAMSS